jgi:hypothetical protein
LQFIISKFEELEETRAFIVGFDLACAPSHHGHPFAFAHASRSADVPKPLSRSRTLGRFGKRVSPEASTAASRGFPTCDSMVRAAGSSLSSTCFSKR